MRPVHLHVRALDFISFICDSKVLYRTKLCRAKLFVGLNFRQPTQKFRPIKVKVSLIEVQVNLTEKQVIYTNYDYSVG